jgi:plasmid replication initiation protein
MKTNYTELGEICEKFFNQIYMYRAITLNSDKVKEALELISSFSIAGGRHEDWEKYRNKVIQKIKEFN